MTPPTQAASGTDPQAFWMHPWEYMPTAHAAQRTVITQAEGIYVQDDTGARMIDGPAGMWCTQIGYGRQEMADAIAARLRQ